MIPYFDPFLASDRLCIQRVSCSRNWESYQTRYIAKLIGNKIMHAWFNRQRRDIYHHYKQIPKKPIRTF